MVKKGKQKADQQADTNAEGELSMVGAFEIAATANARETARVRKTQLQIELEEIINSLVCATPKRAKALLARIKEIQKEIEICKEQMEQPQIDLNI